jgi:hypothetical protein
MRLVTGRSHRGRGPSTESFGFSVFLLFSWVIFYIFTGMVSDFFDGF